MARNVQYFFTGGYQWKNLFAAEKYSLQLSLIQGQKLKVFFTTVPLVNIFMNYDNVIEVSVNIFPPEK